MIVAAILILAALNDGNGCQRAGDGWRPGKAVATRRAEAKQDGRWYLGKNLGRR